MIANNESYGLCSTCKTRCCSSLPGAVFPEQLSSVTVDHIVALLTSGYCLDWWEGDPRIDTSKDLELCAEAIKTKNWDLLPNHKDEFSQVYYIRPKIKGFENKLKHGSWGNVGDCVFLTPTGCSHKFEQRPRECQGLVPGLKDNKRHCINDPSNDKKAACVAWIPYQDILEKAVSIINKQL